MKISKKALNEYTKKYLANIVQRREFTTGSERKREKQKKPVLASPCNSQSILHWKQYELMHGYDRTITYYLLISTQKIKFSLKRFRVSRLYGFLEIP